MPSFNSKCGENLKYGDIPNPIEWLTIPDEEYDAYKGKIDAEQLYRDMKNILKCPNCNRLWIFWDGFDSEPSSYVLEE